jgi:hypothetical protein
VTQTGRRIWRWAMLAAFTWTVHVPAMTGQIELAARDDVVASMSMIDCRPCAACYVGPAPAVCKLENGDRLEVAPSCWAAILDQQVNCIGTAAIAAERPAPALRILYCRWLN